MRFILALILTGFHASSVGAADCDEVMQKYQTTLGVPFQDFTDLSLRKCLELRQVNETNLHAFIAASFYDNSLKIRQAALAKVEAFACATASSCPLLAALLETHLKASQENQARTIAYRTKRLLEKLNITPKDSVACSKEAIKATLGLAEVNGQKDWAPGASAGERKDLVTVTLRGRAGAKATYVVAADSACSVSSVTLVP